jgi:hypothetical protein
LIAARVQEDRDHIDRFAARAPDETTREQAVARALDREYGLHTDEATKLLDPRSPRECAAIQWRPVYTTVLRAAAL